MNASPHHRAIISLLVLSLFIHLRTLPIFGQHAFAPATNGSLYYLNQYVEQEQAKSPAKAGQQERRKQGRESHRATIEQPADQPAATEVTLDADRQSRDGDVYIATGYVILVNGISRLQADKVIYNSSTGEAEADGNVIYDPDPQQRITAQRATLNVYTRKGTFYEATGFTDQTADGAVLNFIAERAEKTGADSYILYGASVTACEQAIPAWRFEGAKAKIRVEHSATVHSSLFRFKNIPILYLPIVKLPIGHDERKSGFLIPATGSSTQKGRFFQDAYYQTLGRSADLLLRGDLYTKRGVGVGSVFRVRTDELSYLKVGTFTVFDRLLGDETTGNTQNDGGTLFFAKGVQYLPHNFLAAVDVDFATKLNFRRTFASEAEQIFNPENRSQFYITNNFSAASGNYSFNILAEKKTDKVFTTEAILSQDSDTNLNIDIRHLPSFGFSGFSQQVASLPLYISFDTAAEGLYRRDRILNATDFITPSVVQRFDMSPKLLLVLPDLAGWIIRPELRLRSTYYSSSLTPASLSSGAPATARGELNPSNIFRKYTEFALDVRPPMLARTFSYDDGTPRFKHTIEPFFTYRKISGIDNFDRIIRFDAQDAVADTNELEYGVINRFFVPRLAADGSIATHEILSISLTQKYFFDPDFGGALRPGARNQFYPIDTLSGFTFGGRERRFSPLNINVRYRPLSTLSADVRLDYDTQEQKVRNFSVTGSITRRNFSFSERFYKTATLQVGPGLIEPGTFPGSLLVSNFSIGNERRGYYGGTSFTYDFTNRTDVVTGLRTRAGLRRSSTYVGYACDCGTIELSFTTTNVGGFRESRITFSFTLSGIGTFGTERLRQ